MHIIPLFGECNTIIAENRQSLTLTGYVFLTYELIKSKLGGQHF